MRQFCRAAKRGDQVCRVCHSANLCQKKYRRQVIKYLDARYFRRIVSPCPALVPKAKKREAPMSKRVATYAEAKALAAEWEEIFGDCDYVVRIISPYFPGDFYLVTMGV